MPLYIVITLERSLTFCPICGGTESTVYDYQTKKITHSISTNNPCFIHYKARRYKCKYCKKIFYETNPFALKNDKISSFTIHIILEALRSHTVTFSDVARQFNLSVPTVINVFDQYVVCQRKPLPRAICMDEVYTSKKSFQKYAFIMVDFINSHVIEVFSSRHKYRLSQNLSTIPKVERNSVEYIIIDMWDTYRDLSEIYFSNALIAVDSFHVIQHLNKAMINIRLKIMRKFDKRTNRLITNDLYYYMLKKFHYFLLKILKIFMMGKFILKRWVLNGIKMK